MEVEKLKHKKMKTYQIVILTGTLLVLLQCTDRDDTLVPNSLAHAMEGRTTQKDSILAFGKTADQNAQRSTIYFIGKSGIKDIRLYQNQDKPEDSLAYSSYFPLKDTLVQEVFSGYFKTITSSIAENSWTIVTYEYNNKLYTSNPVKIYAESQKTMYSNKIGIQHYSNSRPKFTWDSIPANTNRYMQIIENSNGTVINGTYTYKATYQYQETLDSIVNFGPKPLPDLIRNNSYTITIFDLTINHWIHNQRTRTFTVL